MMGSPAERASTNTSKERPVTIEAFLGMEMT